MDDKQTLHDLRRLAFSRLPGSGSRAQAPLLANSDSFDDFLHRATTTAAGLPAAQRGALSRLRAAVSEDEILQREQHGLCWLGTHGGQIVDWFDDHYPPLLRELADPPAVLFCLGDSRLLRQPQLAMVGSRAATNGGLALAQMFAKELTQSGFVITSGLASGIDGAAHRGALQSGPTIAVIGTGLDVCYPSSHHGLRQQIIEQGLLLSELPLGAPPKAGHFPRRNRLIAGLSLGTVVVEAKVRSGSLITARLAMESGREVFALPGSIHNPLSRGPHQLIKQGATLIETSADIIAQLSGGLAYLAEQVEATPAALLSIPSLSAAQQALLQLIGYEPMDVDTLVERSGLAVTELSGLLLELELAGMVLLEAGGYQRCTTQ
ncbi:DNA processing protein [Sinobacterium caligoides]|uniref:DNA processing protein n=1 Tax=Sinobacterium caligoides TaxID=933926 RepID=A0A3N2DGV1_9GAMM|nr:DNA-processing protein DprA [Sinobacterium caligoides]ROR98989.1 DNA processing protein [Sinobacterium caligoides]